MIEHRLIEKMLASFMRYMDVAEMRQKIDPGLIDTAVDFIRIYADRTHHGKEEEILFRALAKKDMAPDLKKIMQELISEHVWSRKTTASLAQANQGYLSGNGGRLSEILFLARELGSFYPRHIEKEDEHFFVPAEEYLSKEEQAEMLTVFWEFDRKMIHEKYSQIVEEYNSIVSR